MRIKFTFNTRDNVTKRNRKVTTVIQTTDFSMDIAKKLWELEQIINRLPDSDTRVNIYIEHPNDIKNH